MEKLGLIAGGGALPATLARHCLAVERPIFVLRLKGFSSPELAAYHGVDVGLGELGAAFSALRSAGCRSVCMTGSVNRPDFETLAPDARGLVALPGALRAARKGDDSLMRFFVQEFEREGFVVEGAHQVMAELTLAPGPLGDVRPSEDDLVDVARAMEAARTIGRLDIGQAAVSCHGVVLALEAQEGTDAMLARLRELPAAVRGTSGQRCGVLAKAAKPGQEKRVDLPTIGPTTVKAAARSGLAGIAGEAGNVLIADRRATRRLADELGLFVLGVAAAA